ncbi:uncharacterized protein LOC111861265 isoform X3 [Cryptotermes secundus]|uniref:uncharacterized protein LOC111861265 isoform X3 n=1 Tax=Cryptotermes secundus TaxID=105785 RepID=UPI001454C0D6|nr:uncharacterized protein LOC111861265 isoform X3 [Cryptotermes secundus]
MEGILYYGQKLHKRVIMEKAQQREILKKIHVEEGTGVHLGLKKMYVRINQFYFWKGLYVDIANFVSQCNQCSETAEVQTSGHGQPQQLAQTNNGDDSGKYKNTRSGNESKVWQKVELKLYGPYPKTVLKNEFIITIADPFSHWVVARPVPGNNHACHIAHFLYKTFCTFGFAKCSFVGVPQEILETAQCKYKEYVSRLQDAFLTCGLMEPQLTSVCGTTVHSLPFFLQENLSQCTWVGKFLDEFVETSPHAWDLELERFLFQYCTTVGRESSSPFTIMFGRNPVSYLEKDKENHNVTDEGKPAEILCKRRRLQSSLLQCRHCEEVFTSKISFRIHQRKHTEEVHCQGTLERQEPTGPAAEKVERLLERTVLRQRQRLFKHDDENKDHLPSSDKCPSQTLLVEDPLYSGNGMTDSPSCFSDNGVLSLDSDNVQNVSTSTSPQYNSARTCQEETVKSDGNTQQILENSPDNSQVTVSGKMETSVQDLRHSNDVSIVVYTETDVPDTLQTNSKGRSGSYTYKLNEKDSSGIQLEAINYPLESRSWNENQCEEGAPNKPNKSSTISTAAELSDVFYCDICGKFFMKKTRLITHIEQHSNPVLKTVHEPLRTYSCTFCKYTGRSTNCLASHMLRSHRKKYKCNICDYSSLTQAGLDRHERICHIPDDRQFACKHCPYRGLKRRQLLDHERIVHTQDKNRHICPVCKKSFRTQVLMKHHLPSHTDLHLYSCKGCSYTTRYRQTFHLHLKQSHPGESFKNLCNGPSEADFEAIISLALKTLGPFPASDEQNIETYYSAQVPENCPVIEDADKLVDVPDLSEHLVSQNIPCTQDTVNGCVDGQQTQIPTLSGYESPQQTETATSLELVGSALVTEAVVGSAHQLISGNTESEQAVTIIDGSGLTSDEVQTIVDLAGDISGSKQEVCHLVTLAGTDMEKTLLQISGYNLEDSKIHRVLTLVNGLVSTAEANQHTGTLLNNVMQYKSNELSTVTHISVAGNSDTSQENLVILPLGESKVAVIQNDSFSNSHLVLDEQTTLLDFVAEQSELIQQQPEKSMKQVTVYHLPQ